MGTRWLVWLLSAVFVSCITGSLCRADTGDSVCDDAAHALVQQINADHAVVVLKGRTLAVTPFQDNTGENLDISDFQASLIAEFTKSRGLRVVERERLDRTLQELKLSSSGLATPASQKELGQLLSADYLLVGSISTGLTGDSRAFHARLVNVETGEIVSTADYLQPVDAKDLRIMIIVPEEHNGRQVANPASETELMKMFTEAGCHVVDQIEYAAIRYTPEMDAIIKDPTGPEARHLTAKNDADILIVGQAFSERSEDRPRGVVSCRAHIELRAVRTHGDGTILAACDKAASGADTAELVAGKIALRKAGHAAGVYLQQQLFGIEVPLPKEEQGKPTIAVAPFDNRSQWASRSWKIEEQIPDLITVSLTANPNITVVDRTSFQQTVNLQCDQISGLYDDAGASAELGTLLKADYLLVGRISEFDTKSRGVRLSSITLGKEQAVVRVLIKVIDMKKGTVVTATEADGEETAAAISGGYENIRFGRAEFDGTALAKATRKAVAQAVNAIQDGMNLTMQCPHCGAAIRAGSKFCPVCGKKIEATPTVCPKCHAKIHPGDKFCPNCGALLPTR